MDIGSRKVSYTDAVNLRRTSYERPRGFAFNYTDQIEGGYPDAFSVLELAIGYTFIKRSLHK